MNLVAVKQSHKLIKVKPQGKPRRKADQIQDKEETNLQNMQIALAHSSNKDEQILYALEKATKTKSEFTAGSTDATERTGSDNLHFKYQGFSSASLSTAGLSKRDITVQQKFEPKPATISCDYCMTKSRQFRTPKQIDAALFNRSRDEIVQFVGKYMIKQEFYETRKIIELLRNDVKTHLVAIFKDHLIYDDIYEFMSEYYHKKVSTEILIRHAEFYDSLQQLSVLSQYREDQIRDRHLIVNGLKPSYAGLDTSIQKHVAANARYKLRLAIAQTKQIQHAEQLKMLLSGQPFDNGSSYSAEGSSSYEVWQRPTDLKRRLKMQGLKNESNPTKLDFSRMIRDSAVVEYSFSRQENGLLLTRDRIKEKERSIDFSKITLEGEIEKMNGSLEYEKDGLTPSEGEIESMYHNAQIILDNLTCSSVQSRAQTGSSIYNQTSSSRLAMVQQFSRKGNKEAEPFCIEIKDQNKDLKEVNTERKRIEMDYPIQVDVQNESDMQSKPLVTEISELKVNNKLADEVQISFQPMTVQHSDTKKSSPGVPNPTQRLHELSEESPSMIKPWKETAKIDYETIKRINERLQKKTNDNKKGQIKLFRDEQDENLGCSPVSLNQAPAVKVLDQRSNQSPNKSPFQPIDNLPQKEKPLLRTQKIMTSRSPEEPQLKGSNNKKSSSKQILPQKSSNVKQTSEKSDNHQHLKTEPSECLPRKTSEDTIKVSKKLLTSVMTNLSPNRAQRLQKIIDRGDTRQKLEDVYRSTQKLLPVAIKSPKVLDKDIKQQVFTPPKKQPSLEIKTLRKSSDLQKNIVSPAIAKSPALIPMLSQNEQVTHVVSRLMTSVGSQEEFKQRQASSIQRKQDQKPQTPAYPKTIIQKKKLLSPQQTCRSTLTQQNVEQIKSICNKIKVQSQNKSNEPMQKSISSRNNGIDRKLSHSDTLHGFISSINHEKLTVQQPQISSPLQSKLLSKGAPKQKLNLRGSNNEKRPNFSPRTNTEITSPLKNRIGTTMCKSPVYDAKTRSNGSSMAAAPYSLRTLARNSTMNCIDKSSENPRSNSNLKAAVKAEAQRSNKSKKADQQSQIALTHAKAFSYNSQTMEDLHQANTLNQVKYEPLKRQVKPVGQSLQEELKSRKHASMMNLHTLQHTASSSQVNPQQTFTKSKVLSRNGNLNFFASQQTPISCSRDSANLQSQKRTNQLKLKRKGSVYTVTQPNQVFSQTPQQKVPTGSNAQLVVAQQKKRKKANI